MQSLYHFVSGPMAWIAFIIFFGGCLFRLVHMLYLVKKKEPFIFNYMSLKYSLRSILHWMTPFATVNMRKHPLLTLVTFAFHISLILSPLFLMAHIILIDEALSISWFALPNSLIDFMTVAVVFGCLVFLSRRLILPEVKFVTSTSDFVLLAFVAAPFITGFIAYHQWPGYPFFMTLHVICGEIMLMIIPFTRLSHMIFSPLTRGYMGSEFGGVRKARDW